nr:capsular polysaccharide synthesis protein [Limosilactobacillus frumenti]
MKNITKIDEVYNRFLLNVAKINRKLNLSVSFRKRFNMMRHKLILNRISSYLLEALHDTDVIDFKQESENNGPIWVFWWQGKDEMPLIVKKCYKSVLRYAGDRQVILINKRNFRKFTDISNIIIDKEEKGMITLTHFSDILRFNLLKNYGGLWLDATMFVTSEITEKYFSPIFTCSGFPNDDYFFVAKGRWTGFLIGGCKGSEIFVFMDNFFKRYWSRNDYLIDYFLIDYALFFAWKNNLSNFYSFTSKTKKLNNPNLFELSKLLNKPFNLEKYNSILKDTEMYKLSYKKNLSHNENSFYNIIINSDVNLPIHN